MAIAVPCVPIALYAGAVNGAGGHSERHELERAQVDVGEHVELVHLPSRLPLVQRKFQISRRPASQLVYGMLCRSDPQRDNAWTLRVDVPSLCVGVVVRVNLHFCAGNVDAAALDIEYRADLGRERPAVAFPYTGQPEAFRRYRSGKPDGSPYGPRAGYGMLRVRHWEDELPVVVGVVVSCVAYADIYLPGVQNHELTVYGVVASIPDRGNVCGFAGLCLISIGMP